VRGRERGHSRRPDFSHANLPLGHDGCIVINYTPPGSEQVYQIEICNFDPPFNPPTSGGSGGGGSTQDCSKDKINAALNRLAAKLNGADSPLLSDINQIGVDLGVLSLLTDSPNLGDYAMQYVTTAEEFYGNQIVPVPKDDIRRAHNIMGRIGSWLFDHRKQLRDGDPAKALNALFNDSQTAIDDGASISDDLDYVGGCPLNAAQQSLYGQAYDRWSALKAFRQLLIGFTSIPTLT